MTSLRTLILTCCCFLLLSCEDPRFTPLPSGAVVLAFGDSLTFGTGVDPEHSYPVVLESLINRTVIKSGVPGERTAQGLKRLESVLDKTNPDFVILMEGGNDILRNLNLTETEENLSRMIKLIQSRKMAVLLIGIPEKSLFSKRCAEFYRSLADKHNVVLDCKTVPSLLRDNRYKSDAVHFNEAGYQALATEIAALLSREGAL